MTIKMTLFWAVGLLLLPLCLSSCEGSPNPFPTIDANFSKVATHQYG